MADVPALHKIFDQLLEISSPSRGSRVLRQAIAALASSGPRLELEDGAIGSPVNPVGAIEIPAMRENQLWIELRPQLRALVLPADSARRKAIADELMIAPTTLVNICARSSLSWALTNRVAAWLKKPQPTKADPALLAKANGAGYLLDPLLRGQLEFMIEHRPNDVRKEAGVTLDVARQAANGSHLAADIITRISDALQR
jgi:hypothetical protein